MPPEMSFRGDRLPQANRCRPKFAHLDPPSVPRGDPQTWPTPTVIHTPIPFSPSPLIQPSTRSNVLSTNTHDADGKWSDSLSMLKSNKFFGPAEDIAVDIVTSTVNVQTFSSLLDFGESLAKIRPEAGRYFAAIIQGQGNYDSSNRVDALTLLILLSLLMDVSNREKDEGDGMMDILAEQLADMASGPCPEGRTTRLAQIAMCFV